MGLLLCGALHLDQASVPLANHNELNLLHSKQACSVPSLVPTINMPLSCMSQTGNSLQLLAAGEEQTYDKAANL